MLSRVHGAGCPARRHSRLHSSRRARQRQATLNYTLPFAMGGVRLLTPTGIDGTPESLKGQTIGVINNSVAAVVGAPGATAVALPMAPAAVLPTVAVVALPTERVGALRTGEHSGLRPHWPAGDSGHIALQSGLQLLLSAGSAAQAAV